MTEIMLKYAKYFWKRGSRLLNCSIILDSNVRQTGKNGKKLIRGLKVSDSRLECCWPSCCNFRKAESRGKYRVFLRTCRHLGKCNSWKWKHFNIFESFLHLLKMFLKMLYNQIWKENWKFFQKILENFWKFLRKIMRKA